MSPKNSILKVGLTALGSMGLAALSAADPASSPATAQPQASAAAPSTSPTVLSLYDGRVLQGKIQADDAGYSLIRNGGVLRLRKELVEGAFGSIQEIYRFKAGRLPERDPDERLKLAHWCLAQHLEAEAREQLQAVLELSPGNSQIENMISNLDNALARKAPRDEGVTRTNIERPIDDRGRPAELDAEVFRPGRPKGAALGLPVIFDLPTAQAVRRAEDFTRSVHPVLQNYCARCHNENYPGEFQLIQVKTRHDWTPDVARANLEAALRMVDPDSPSRSELLTRGLVPHGPLRRPIFPGANNASYQRIAAWVNSLRPRPSGEQAATSRFGAEPPAPSPSEGFATDRPPSPMASPRPDRLSDGRPVPPETPNPRTPLPPGRFVAGSDSGNPVNVPADADFPVPYMVGGARPKPEATPAPAPVPQGQPAPTADGTLPPLPTAAPAPAAPAPAAPATPAPAPAPTAQAVPKPPSRPVKLDPALLERALMNKYSPN